jgi:hypothetical protein
MKVARFSVAVTVAVMGLGLFAPFWSQAQSEVPIRDRWMVAAGGGSCAAVTSIKGELWDVPAWEGPEEFVNALRAKGLQVSTVMGEYQGRYMVKVVVPARHVDVVFVPYSLCRAMWQEELDRASRKPSKR